MSCTKKTSIALSRYYNCGTSTVLSSKNTTCTIRGMSTPSSKNRTPKNPPSCRGTAQRRDHITLEHPGPHKLAAWMGSTRATVPTLSASPTSHFFKRGKVRKTPVKPHLHRHANDSMRKLRNPGPGRKSGRPRRAGKSTICSATAAEFCTGREP